MGCQAMSRAALAIVFLLVAACSSGAVEVGPSAPTAQPTAAAGSTPAVEAVQFPGTVILGSPTDHSVIVSLAAAAPPLEAYIEHGPASGQYSARTDVTSFGAATPAEIELTGLEPDAAWFYRIHYRQAASGRFLAAPEASFRTQRAAGSTFTFAIEADPHVGLDDKASQALWRQALANVRAARPDFLVDLGDTFMGDKLGRQGVGLEQTYAGLRDSFSIPGSFVPLFLVNGNHDGESGWSLADGPDGLAARAADARRLYYPNPAPGGFYSGGAAGAAEGLRDSSYAWEWGDALFVVLDPYSATARKPGASGDLWGWTLGEVQYRWLEQVLQASTSRNKFVFAHHVIGDVRGGIAWAGLYEWGGHGADGAYAFDQERPGWGSPIHELFVRYGVTAFFQGHDHLFAREEVDGIVYQTVPQPATQGGDPHRMAAEYGYVPGVILGSPGHLEVTVAATGVTVRYVHASTGAGDRSGLANGEPVYTYTIPARTGSAPSTITRTMAEASGGTPR